MADANTLVEILKTEYGIKTVEDLQRAIESIGGIDISIFCSKGRTKE